MLDPTELAGLMAKMGIQGVDPTKLAAAMELVGLLGKDTSIDEEGVQSYFPSRSEESMFMPKVSKNFYYNPDLFRRLVTPDLSKLASLVIPNIRRLRR